MGDALWKAIRNSSRPGRLQHCCRWILVRSKANAIAARDPPSSSYLRRACDIVGSISKPGSGATSFTQRTESKAIANAVREDAMPFRARGSATGRMGVAGEPGGRAGYRLRRLRGVYARARFEFRIIKIDGERCTYAPARRRSRLAASNSQREHRIRKKIARRRGGA